MGLQEETERIPQYIPKEQRTPQYIPKEQRGISVNAKPEKTEPVHGSGLEGFVDTNKRMGAGIEMAGGATINLLTGEGNKDRQYDILSSHKDPAEREKLTSQLTSELGFLNAENKDFLDKYKTASQKQNIAPADNTSMIMDSMAGGGAAAGTLVANWISGLSNEERKFISDNKEKYDKIQNEVRLREKLISDLGTIKEKETDKGQKGAYDFYEKHGTGQSLGDKLIHSGEATKDAIPAKKGFWYNTMGFLPVVASTAATIGAGMIAPGTVIPSLIGGGTMGAFVIQALGDGYDDYKDYMKGKGLPADDLTAYKMGIASGAIMTIAMKIPMAKVVPKSLLEKMITKEVFANPKYAVELVDQWAKKFPKSFTDHLGSFKTYVGEGSAISASNVLMEVGGAMLSNSYKDPAERAQMDEIFKASAEGIKSGFIFAAFIHPMSAGANARAARLRNKEGIALLTIKSKPGVAYEMLNRNAQGEVIVMDSEGVQSVIRESDIDLYSKFNRPELDKLIGGIKKAKPQADAIKQEVVASQAERDFREGTAGMIGKTGDYKGKITEATHVDELGEDGQPKKYYILGEMGGATGIAVVYDPATRSTEKQIKLTDLKVSSPIDYESTVKSHVEKQVKDFSDNQANEEGLEPGFVDESTKIETGKHYMLDGQEIVISSQDPGGKSYELAEEQKKGLGNIIILPEDKYSLLQPVEVAKPTAEIKESAPIPEVSTEPLYEFDGQAITKEKAMAKILKAELLKKPETISNLKITNDPELLAVIEKKFPQVQPSYKYGKEKISKEVAIELINDAENIEELNGLVVTNDKEVQDAMAKKFAPVEEPDYKPIAGDGLQQVVVAPFYNTSVSSAEEAAELRKSEKYQQQQQHIKDVAGSLGIEIDNVSENIGGFENLKGEKLTEVSNTITIKGTIKQAEELASILGGTSVETQESTIAKEYVEPGSERHLHKDNGVDELSIAIGDVNKTLAALSEAKIYNYTLNQSDGTVSIIDFSKGNDLDVDNKISTFIDILKNKNVTHGRPERRAADSRYIESDLRAKILERMEGDAVQSGQDRSSISNDYIQKAKRGTEEFRNKPGEPTEQPAGEPVAPAPVTPVTEIIQEPVKAEEPKPEVTEANSNEAITAKVEDAGAKTDLNPTDVQKESGEYVKGKVVVQDIPIQIENPIGSVRKGEDANGKPWETTMQHPYGQIEGTIGNDGKPLDVFIGNKPASKKIFIIDQINPETGKFDEHKVMLGFESDIAAERAYLDNYEHGWNNYGTIHEMSVDEFKTWSKEGKKTEPASPFFDLNKSGIKKLMEGWNKKALRAAELIFVHKQDELPDRLNDKNSVVEGAYGNGKVYVVLDNIKNTSHAAKVWMHEQGVHKGLKSLFVGEGSYAERMRDVYKSVKNSPLMKDIEANYSDYTKEALADEYLAHLSAKFLNGSDFKALDDLDVSSWRQASSWLRSNIRRVVPFVKLSDQDIANLIYDSYLSVHGKAPVFNKPGNLVEEPIADIRQSKELFDHTNPDHIKQLTDLLQVNGTPQWRINGIARNIAKGDPIMTEAYANDIARLGFGDKDVRHSKELVVNGQSIPKMLDGTDRFMEAMQDRMLSLKRIQEKVMEKGGKLDPIMDAYSEENRSASKSHRAIIDFDENIYTPLWEHVTKIVSEKGMTLEEVQGYLKAKHAIERNERMNSGIKTADAEVTIKSFESRVDPAMVDELWADIRKATRFTLDRNMEDGFLLRDEYDKLVGTKNVDGTWATEPMYNYYVPLRGWAERTKPEDVFDYLDNVDRVSLNPLRKAEGRTTESEDPLATIQSMAHTSIASGEKNRIKQHAARMILANKDMTDLFFMKKVWLVNTGATDPNTGKPVMIETSERPAQDLFDKGLVTYSYNRGEHTAMRNDAMRSQHEADVFMGGNRYTMVFQDPAVANAINKKNTFAPEMTAGLQKWMSPITRGMSALQTVLNPAFIVPNQIRDTGFAMMKLSIEGDISAKDTFMNYKKSYGSIYRELYKKDYDPINNVSDKWYKEFLDNGGETGLVHLKDVETLQKDLEKKVAKLERSLTTGATCKDVLGNTFTSAHKVLSNFAALSENSTRFAVYMTAREAGKTVNESIDAAKNSSVNFNRKGTAAGLLGTNFAFFNASIQGSENFIRMGMRHTKKFAVGAGLFTAVGVLTSMYNTMMGGEDENGVPYYQLKSDYAKRNSWMIAIGKNNFVTIPLPHGFRSFYGLGVIGHQLETGQVSAGKALVSSVSNFLDQLSPVPSSSITNKKGELSLRPIIPTPFVPLYDIAVNEDYMGTEVYSTPFMKTWDGLIADSKLGKAYVNKPIESLTTWMAKQARNGQDSNSKYYVNNGEVKKIPGMFDLNPSKIEHILEGYFGGLGKFGTDLVKLGSGIVESADASIREDKNFGEEMGKNININIVPIANKFYTHSTADSGQKKYSVVRNAVETYNFLKSQADKSLDASQIEAVYGVKGMESMAFTYAQYKSLLDNITETTLLSKDPEVVDAGIAKKKELIDQMVRKIEEDTKTIIKF